MRILLLLCCCGWMLYPHAQKRIDFNVSSRFLNLNLTSNLHYAFKNHFMLSAGIYSGGAGSTMVLHDTNLLYSSGGIQSPYPGIEWSISDTTTSYELLDYSVKGKFVGIQTGIGYFWEFGGIHGFRINALFKAAFTLNEVGVYYRSKETHRETLRHYDIQHFAGGVTLNLFHTIRITGKTTLFYGIKTPYYFTLDRARFNPRNRKDLFYGFEPELSIGFTRLIGVCR